jgi:hypothetical protein
MARKEQEEATEKASNGTVTAQASPLRYVGDGEYIYGVPARNLSAAEAAMYGTTITATAAATGRVLYAPMEREE